MSVRNLLHLNHSATKKNICFTAKLQILNISFQLKLQAFHFFFFHDKVLVLTMYFSLTFLYLMIIPAILKNIALSDIPYMYYCIYLLFFPLFLPQKNGKK